VPVSKGMPGQSRNSMAPSPCSAWSHKDPGRGWCESEGAHKLFILKSKEHFAMTFSIGPVRWEEQTLGTVTRIFVLSVIIFYIDVITPLGLTAWILYLIPLFLTLYIRWKYAPFVVAGAFILLMGASLFLSPLDTSFLFAVLNRVFFSLVLVITALFIWRFGQNVEELRLSEERYRYLTDWSPDAKIVYSEGKILFTNPVGLRMFGANSPDELIGKDIAELVDGSQKDLVTGKLKQAAMGARMQVPGVRLVQSGGHGATVEMVLGGIIWDGKPAVQVILRGGGSS
jgi:PAS domain S-box-containing protein